MSYDYSSEGQQLELPNPYKLQNRVLLVCAALLLGGALLALWWARLALLRVQAGEGLKADAFVCAGVGLALLVLTLWCGATALSRLRFFFGRGRPVSLAGELAPGSEGGSPQAERLKELLRHGALSYPEPQGALEGLLYHWAPRLITAPLVVQEEARHHVFNAVALALTLLSFLIGWGLLGDAQTRPWLAAAYAGFALFFLLRPLVNDRRAHLNLSALLLLAAGAILGPVLAGLAAPHLPDLHGLNLAPQTAVMLVAGLLAAVLSAAAALAQVQPPGATQTSAVQRRLSMAAPPGLLMDELERQLQAGWTERIPSRRYARGEPVIDPSRHTGPFAGELVEESQPLPHAGSVPPDLAAALASGRHRMLVALDFYAALLLLASLAVALRFAHGFDFANAWADGRWGTAGIAGLLALVAGFCLRGSALLWGRFDFDSVLLWVEVGGTYQSAQVGTGNQLSSRLNTQSQVLRSEAMTLRVWRARLESVVFGKDAGRQITAMFSTEREAEQLAEQLLQFAQSQSVFVAPLGAEDAARAQSLQAAEQLLGGATPAVLAATAPPPPQAPARLAAAHCHHCGAALAAAARFCSACGTAVPA